MIRLIPDQSSEIRRSPKVNFSFDGRIIPAHKGETVFTALTRAGAFHLRDAPVDGAPRGAFCCMGLCQECVVEVDGLKVESCRKTVFDGLVVRSQRSNPDD